MATDSSMGMTESLAGAESSTGISVPDDGLSGGASANVSAAIADSSDGVSASVSWTGESSGGASSARTSSIWLSSTVSLSVGPLPLGAPSSGLWSTAASAKMGFGPASVCSRVSSGGGASSTSAPF